MDLFFFRRRGFFPTFTLCEEQRKKHVSLHEHLANFLRSKGLAEKDIPKVLSSFFIAKYVTLVAFIFIGVKFQPLTKIFRASKGRYHQEVSRVKQLDTPYALNVKKAEVQRKKYVEWRGGLREKIQTKSKEHTERIKAKVKEKEKESWYQWLAEKYDLLRKNTVN